MATYTHCCLALAVIGLLVQLPLSVRPSEPEDDDAFSERSAVLAADETDPHLAAASASALAALSGEGVEISPEWLEFEFDLIDDDGSGKINRTEWDEEVSKAWGEPMWKKLDEDGGGNFSKDEFVNTWDAAVSAAFKSLGGDDEQITADERKKKFEGAEDYEMALAEQVAGGDGNLDRSEFEEFVYTVIAFNAMNPEDDDSISAKDLEALKKGEFLSKNKLLMDIPDEEMKIADLYSYFKEKKQVFQAS